MACSVLGCAEGAVCMFPWHQTAFRWASVCLSAGPDSSRLGYSSTTDRGSVRQLGICWWASARHCQEVLVDVPSCMLAMAQNNAGTRELYLFAVWEVSSQQPCSMFFCALMLSFLKMELVFFLLYCYLQNHLLPEPHHCFLRVNCMIVKKYVQGLFCLVFTSLFVLCIL